MTACSLLLVTFNGNNGFATLWQMEMQLYGKITCNFVEKDLAKNNTQ